MLSEPRDSLLKLSKEAKIQAVVFLVLILILSVGAYFRFVGINWDSDQHQHPDERFMAMVAEQISPVDSFGEYFDTDNSPLNPLGYGFYTYGMMPLFLTRYVAEWVGRTEYNEIVLVGRALSGLFDLAAVGLLFLLGARLYGRWVGLLAAALYAAAVLAIQLSHFFAVDSFTTVFLLTALYAAVLVMEEPRWWAFILFGLSTGLAMTTKISIAPLAGVLVVAGIAYLVAIWPEPEKRLPAAKRILLGLVVAGLYAAIVFRIFQPYAFAGSGFFSTTLNPRWLEIIGQVNDQVAGRADFPPNHHWAGRPWSYGWSNMVRWGMGLPLGLMATFGFIWAAWRCLRGHWRSHILLVVWGAGFFFWQNSHFWRYTRYFLPVYPVAILFASWALVEIVKRARAYYGQLSERDKEKPRSKLPLVLAWGLLIFVLLDTYAYAFAFTRIYTRPHTRVVATAWMEQNIPASSVVAVETSWDDMLPLRIGAFDTYKEPYKMLNLELFEPDDEEKRERLLEMLEQVDYLVIASNRVYDAVPRLPLRYPMTTAYYRALFGCDGPHFDACAYAVEAPMQGDLGFDLVATFESYPNIGPLQIPDQAAQESFTVYDHPRVLIFKKSPDFSGDKLRELLEGVDLSQVVAQSAGQYTQAPSALRLSEAQLLLQKGAGTWSEAFSFTSLLNQSAFLSTASWYILIALIGLLAFPITAITFRGLHDRGYGLNRLVGLLVVAWFAWIGGSLQVLPFTRATAVFSLLLLGVINAFLGWKYRQTLVDFLRRRWRHILTIETLFLLLFLFQLAVRWHNPDLWHPWRGGEKPGDFALLNAVLKSVHFPPYDPWMAGNFVNYYYYGYVLSAMPVKIAGIVPAVAYNLLLPMWYALTGVGIFTVAYDLVSPWAKAPEEEQAARRSKVPYLAGFTALAAAILLGNLFEVRVLWNRLPEFSPNQVENLTLFQHTGDVLSGLNQVLSDREDLFRGDTGPWYFDASRAILNGQDDTPITEFPFFTFLYADLHPHLLDMPVVLAALAWMLGILRSPAIVSKTYRWGDIIPALLTWLVAGLVFGATYPTNSWDFPIVLALGVAAIGYAVWTDSAANTTDTILRLLLRTALLIFLAVVLYAPFHRSFGTGDLQPELWAGRRTPLVDYFTVHGLFLFLIITYLVLETIRWLRPRIRSISDSSLAELASKLKGVEPYLIVALLIILVSFSWAWRNNYQTALFALLLCIWAALLLLRRDQTTGERVVLTLIIVGTALSFVAEFVALKGDIGRMNVVFKLYLLIWLFFSIAIGVSLAWIWYRLEDWNWRWTWLLALELLVIAAAAYPIVGTLAKVQDRWPGVSNPPKTLDGMAFMSGESNAGSTGSASAVFTEQEQPLHLRSDYEAMRWMLENVPGTPTIIEAHSPEYRWGSRYAVYTGLPTVVGWSWHLRQHNAVLPDSVVEKRIEDVHAFYNTTDVLEAREILEHYQVDYVILGELERVQYEAQGLKKFAQMVADGELSVAYEQNSDGENVIIYKVTQSPANDI